MCEKFVTDCRNMLHYVRIKGISVWGICFWSSRILSVVVYGIFSLSGWMTWPRQVTVSVKKEHFLGLSVIPAYKSCVNTRRRLLRYCSTVFEETKTSSKNTRADRHLTEDRKTSIFRWKVARQFFSHNGIPRNWYRPWWPVKAVFSRSRSSILNFDELEYVSKVENMFFPYKHSYNFATLPSSMRSDSYWRRQSYGWAVFRQPLTDGRRRRV